MAVPRVDGPVGVSDDVLDLASHGLVVSDGHRRRPHVVLAGELLASLDAVPPLAVGVKRLDVTCWHDRTFLPGGAWPAPWGQHAPPRVLVERADASG